MLNRCRERAPNLHPFDRDITWLCAKFMRPTRLVPSAVVLKPSTIIGFHRALVKRRNPRFACRRITQRLSLAFGIAIDEDVARRVLAMHYRSNPRSGGPSWFTLLGHSKNSLWSIGFFRCESLISRTHWVMVVMDQYTSWIVGFAIHSCILDGATVCRMFNSILGGFKSPRYLGSNHDPFFEFHRWKANLRILDIQEVKTAPYVPLSHPFIGRLVGTIRREFLEHVPFWGARDLERKLLDFQDYYSCIRVHVTLHGITPGSKAGDEDAKVADLRNYRWQSHCRGLYQLPGRLEAKCATDTFHGSWIRKCHVRESVYRHALRDAFTLLSYFPKSPITDILLHRRRVLWRAQRYSRTSVNKHHD